MTVNEIATEVEYMENQGTQSRRDYFIQRYISEGATEEEAEGWAEKALTMSYNGCTDDQIFSGLAFKERLERVAI